MKVNCLLTCWITEPGYLDENHPCNFLCGYYYFYLISQVETWSSTYNTFNNWESPCWQPECLITSSFNSRIVSQLRPLIKINGSLLSVWGLHPTGPTVECTITVCLHGVSHSSSWITMLHKNVASEFPSIVTNRIVFLH